MQSTKRDLSKLAEALMPTVARAGAVIMNIYDGAFAVQKKADNSPLTLADLESQRVIAEGLTQLTPDVPILSEESAQAPWAERKHWTELWVVDPLDGTREFVKRNGEFTINIALVVDHEPLLGIVAAPAQGLLYWGARGVGAFSRHRGAAQSSIHVAAAGQADLYPRFGPTSEWDTAAGQALLEAAGGQVTRPDGHRLRYNCRESLINGDFIAFGHPGIPDAAG
jgi:3'(2'), 5'-bisphosphate nucleotidase